MQDYIQHSIRITVTMQLFSPLCHLTTRFNVNYDVESKVEIFNHKNVIHDINMQGMCNNCIPLLYETSVTQVNAN